MAKNASGKPRDALRAPRIASVSSFAVVLSMAFSGLAQEPIALAVEGQARSVEYSPDGRLLAAFVNRRSARGESGPVIVVYDVAQRTKTHTLDLVRSPSIKSFAFSPDGQVLAAASTDRIRLWNTGAWTELEAIPAIGAVQSICFSPDGGRLYHACAVTGDDLTGNVRIWDLHRRAEARVLDLKSQAIRTSRSWPSGTHQQADSCDCRNSRLLRGSHTTKHVWAGPPTDDCLQPGVVKPPT